MKIAIIPARGGSQRIKRKNIKSFCGKPMISWVIDVLFNSKFFDEILVSTDDNEIRDISIKLGVKVPFVRPKNLSDNYTATVPVISHSIKEVERLGWNVKYACCVYPCNPFLKIEDIKKSFKILCEKKYNYIYPVTDYPHPIQRSMIRSKNGKIKFKYPEFELTRTQDLENFYHDAGQFYWGTRSAWIRQKKMHTEGSTIFIPAWRVVDIDTIDDWTRAEKIFKSNII